VTAARAACGLALASSSRAARGSRNATWFTSARRPATFCNAGGSLGTQSPLGTLIAQDDVDHWTLQARPKPGEEDRLDPNVLLVRGFGGPGLLEAYDAERRPVGLRNRQASAARTEVRMSIAQAYAEAGDSLDPPAADRRRAALAARIAALVNAENESLGIELGYAYPRSPIVCRETDT
jgi:hypothetical protein